MHQRRHAYVGEPSKATPTSITRAFVKRIPATTTVTESTANAESSGDASLSYDRLSGYCPTTVLSSVASCTISWYNQPWDCTDFSLDFSCSCSGYIELYACYSECEGSPDITTASELSEANCYAATAKAETKISTVPVDLPVTIYTSVSTSVVTKTTTRVTAISTAVAASSSIDTGTTVGIAIGSIAGAAVIVTSLLYIWRKRRSRLTAMQEKGPAELHSNHIHRPPFELDQSDTTRYQLHDDAAPKSPAEMETPNLDQSSGFMDLHTRAARESMNSLAMTAHAAPSLNDEIRPV